jgi:diacylglycerol kinase (ATP)
MAIQALEPRVRIDKFFAAPEYAVSTLWNAAQWSGLNLHLWADEHEVEGRFILAVATNIRHYMGGLSNLSPDAYIDDGLLDLWLFSGSNLGDALRHAYELWRGSHVNSEAAQRIPFRNLRVEADAASWIHTDGEARGSARVAAISVQAHALKLLVPPAGMNLLRNSAPQGMQ